MKKDGRQLASEWSLPEGKIISPRTVRRRLFNADDKNYTTIRKKPSRKPHHYYIRFIVVCHHYK